MNVENLQDIYELSPLQQGMLFHTLYAPEAKQYFEQMSFSIPQAIDTTLLRKAWQHVLDRHEALRTAFHWDGIEKPAQVAYRRVDLRLHQEDWRALPSRSHASRLQAFLKAERERGFELSEAPLLRIALIQTANAEYQFVLSFHHLILDGWSLNIVLNEVQACYEAFSEGRDPLLAPSRPYGNFIGWLQRQDLAAAEEFWRRSLKDFRGTAPLVIGEPAHSSFSADDHAEEQAAIPKDSSDALRSWARQHHLTVNTLIQGAWALLLSHYSGERDISFGTTISGRPADLEGSGSMVGLFINTVPVRVRIEPGQPGIEFLRELQKQQFSAQQYEYVSLVQIHEWSEVPPGKPLFETLVVFENYPVAGFEVNSDTSQGTREVDVIERVNYPLCLVIAPGQQLFVRMLYIRSRFERATVMRVLGHFYRLLESLIEDPLRTIGDISPLTDQDRRQLLVEWNDTVSPYPRERSVARVFEEQAARSPDAIAVVFGDTQVTYTELNRRANQLAHYLRGFGVGPETLVGLQVERSAEMVLGMLGILKAGGAYVPLDPEYPLERLAFMLEDAQAPVVLTQERLRGTLPPGSRSVILLDGDWGRIAEETMDNPDCSCTGESLAYVMYTSGSTGKPKGVCVVHRGIVRLVLNTNYVSLTPSDRIAQASNASFDAATFEIWGALLSGATLVGIPKEVMLSPRELAAQIRKDLITVMFLTTELFVHCVHEVPDAFRTVRNLIVGGSAMPVREVREMLARAAPRRILNVYGPTESTTFATWYPVESVPEHAISIPIGYPVANTEIYLLSEDLSLVPVGVPGEIYIGGEGLARDYLHRPVLTAERFVRHPFRTDPGARLYRTGDLGRYRSDGVLEFLGRRDNQVKLRGFRVEMGEIEAVLRQHPAVREAAVVVREDAPGDKRLVAYVCPGRADGITAAELRKFLRRQLPEYMLPATFVLLETLPLNPNGKIDRAALPAPERDRREVAEQYERPRNTTEKILAELWGDVLNLERVGVHDDFFELGGHSLLATRLSSRIRDAFQVDLPLRAIFESSTISQLATLLDQAKARGEEVREPALVRVPREQYRGAGADGGMQKGPRSRRDQ
jgi:amino acid adenylation domain-containing protein